MKVLFLNHEFPRIGSESGEACFYLMQEYSKNDDIEITYVTLSEDEKYHLLKMGNNITIHCLPLNKKSTSRNIPTSQLLRQGWKMYKFSLELLKNEKYEVSHSVFSIPAGLASFLLYQKRRLPYVLSLQNFDLTKRNKIVKILISKIFKNSSYVVTYNEKSKLTFSETFFGKEMGIIRNEGVDLEGYFPDASKRDDTKFILLCESEITPMMGVRFLIQAFNLISSRYYQARLNVIGQGSERESLKDLVRALGIEDKVNFIGDSSEETILKYYQESDVFVSPALDSKANKGAFIRKALACGLPIITTSINEKYVQNDKNGFIVAIKTADDLAEKIEMLILDKNLKDSMAKNSLMFADEISWRKISDQYINLYIKCRNLGKINNS